MTARPRQIVKAQRMAPVGLGVGSVAIDGGTEDQVVARRHLVVNRDAVPVEAVLGAERGELAQHRQRQARRLPIRQDAARLRAARLAEVGAQREERHQAMHAAQRHGEAQVPACGRAAERDHRRPVAGRRCAEPRHEVGAGDGDLAGRIDGNRPQPAAIHVACADGPMKATSGATRSSSGSRQPVAATSPTKG